MRELKRKSCDIGRFVTVCAITDDSLSASFPNEFRRIKIHKRPQSVTRRRTVERRRKLVARLVAGELRREAIRAAYRAGGITMQQIGDRYGITRQRVEQIVKHG